MVIRISITIKFVYELVTDALGLDANVCRRRGLRLMVTWDPPYYIGLTEMDLCGQPTRGEDWHPYDKNRVKTICTVRAEKQAGCSMLEVVEVEGAEDGATRYRPVGVWVPQMSTAFNNIGGFVDSKGYDSFLV
jgi:hypothetical protein